jgi:hypothetical protein
MSSLPKSLPLPVSNAMKFVRNMFTRRNYRKKTKLFTYENLWQMFTVSATGDRVMAMFGNCNPLNDIMNITEYSECESNDVASEDMESFEGNEKSSKNHGITFIKTLVLFSLEKNIKIIILVTDTITKQAIKVLPTLENVNITFFTYAETGNEYIDHVFQPTKFEALTPNAKSLFIQQNPRYEQELTRLPVEDALVKYYGLRVGDIVYVEESDKQSGLVVDHCLIVEHLLL